MKPSGGSGDIPAFARLQRSSQVKGQWAPAQCCEAADNQVAKESEVREDRERDDEVIHR